MSALVSRRRPWQHAGRRLGRAMSIIPFNIPLPKSKDGYSRRDCAKRECRKAFHIQANDAPEMIHCPYCGASAGLEETHSPTDMAYARKVLEEKAMKYAHDEFSKMLGDVFGG